MAGIILSIFAVLAFVAIGGRRLIKHQLKQAAARRDELAMGARCPCGYPLSNLDMGRCPECGRVLHFEANAEQLGLTTEQLARIAEKRRAREAKQ